MVHMICDFCGNPCDREGYLLSITPIHNFMNEHKSNIDFKIDNHNKNNFICCQNCFKKEIKLPNPYEEYSQTCDESKLYMDKNLLNYTDEDFLKDKNN